MEASDLAVTWVSRGVPHDVGAFFASATLMVATVESVSTQCLTPVKAHTPYLIIYVAYVQVKLLARRGLLSSYTTRKLLHMSAGPVFLITWPWFHSGQSRWIAACVPLAMTLKFALVGFGVLLSDADIKTMSRSGSVAVSPCCWVVLCFCFDVRCGVVMCGACCHHAPLTTHY